MASAHPADIPFGRVSRFLSVVFLAATVGLAAAGEPQAAGTQPADLIKALSAYPALNGIKVADAKAVDKYFTVTLGGKKTPAIAFNTGTEQKPVWNVAVYAKTFDFSRLYNNKSPGAALGGLALSDVAMVIAPAQSSVKLADLPKPVQSGITAIFGTRVSNVTYPAGINFSAKLALSRSDFIKELRSDLDVSDTSAAMAGTVGADVLRYLANGLAKTAKGDLAAVSLAAQLKGIRAKDASSAFTSPSTLILYRADKAETVRAGAYADVTVVVDKEKWTFKAGFAFDAAAKNADNKRISITGAFAAKLSKPLKVGAISTKVLNLDAAIMGNHRLTVAFTGTDAAGKPFQVGAEVARGKIELMATFPTNATVKDILGYSQQALDKLAFKDPKQVGEIVTGIVKLAGEDMEAFAFKPDPRDKHPYLALVPKSFSFASWVPKIKGTPLDAAAVDKAALMVVPTGGGGDRALKDLPKLVADKVAAVVGADTIRDNKNKLPIADGVNLYARVDVGKSNAMRLMFDALGIKEKLLTLVGSVNPVVFWVLPDKVSAELKQDKKIHEEILKTLRIATKISRSQIPGVDKVLEFTPGELRFRGDAVYDRMGARTDTGDVEVVAEIAGGVNVKLPGKTLGLATQLNFHKGIADKSYEVKIVGTSKIDWQKAFGIPFLTLGDIGLAATLDMDKTGKRTFVAGLKSKIQLGKQALESSVELVIEKNKFEDFVLSVPGKVSVASLPGLEKIPGINGFAFEDLTLSKADIHGKLEWKPLGYKAAAAFVVIDGKHVLFARVHDLSIKTLLPKLPKPLDMVAELKMPRAVLAFSSQKLTNFELGNLPAAAQDMLKDIFKSSGNEVPIWDGVTVIGALGEKDLPKPLHKVIAEDLGVFKVIDGDLVLAGGVNGVFGGNAKIGLYADLPGFKFPDGQPWSRIVSFEKAKANFFIRADVAATMLSLGVGGDMQLRVPHLDDPKKVDTLKFRGEGYVSADAVSAAGGVKVAGRMEGKWREPFGLKNFAFENPAILVGADSEGSVEFGIGATAEFAARGNQTLRFAGDFITNINFSSTIPLPKKLGMRLQAKKLGVVAQLEVADSLIRGVMTGPMANVVTELLRDPAAKKTAQTLQAQIKNKSLLDLLQIEKLPLPLFEAQDVDLYFATPGAVIPGREDTLAGMGLVAACKLSLNLMGQRIPLAETDNRLTFKDGLKIYSKIEPRTLGPLKLKNAFVDVAANIQSLPHFKIKTDTELFGTTEKLDMELSKDKMAFFYDKNLGPLLKLRVDAKTVGEDLFRARDFIVTASAGSKLDDILVREVMPRMGIPEVIGKAIQKSNPLLITGASFNGSLTEFVTGKPVTLKLEHKLFGTQAEPAVVQLKPVWKDPLSAFPAIPIAQALNRSMLFYLAAHPVKLPAVDLGLLKLSDVTLGALTSDPKDPKFRVSGKSQFLGATRAVDVALSENAYVFNLKDKIAGGLWNADLRGWSVGGTAANPGDIQYYGTVSSDFNTWLQKSVGGTLNKTFDSVGQGYRTAQNDLKAAEDKVRGINSLIEARRNDARRDLNRIRNLIRAASDALGHADWLFRKARDAYEWLRKKRSSMENGGWFPFKGAAVWAAKKLEWAAEEVLDGARKTRDAAQRALNNIANAEVPLDLHPLVAPLIVAREVAVTTLRGVQVAFAAAEGINNAFKDVTNKLINAVAGAKILVVKKAVFTGSVKEVSTDFHVNADIMNSPNHFMRLKVNLSRPLETDLRDLAVTITSIIKGEKEQAKAGAFPEPPQLPLATVSKKDIQAAILAAAQAEIARRKATEQADAQRQQQLAAASQSASIANAVAAGENIWIIGTNKIGNDWGIFNWAGRSWRTIFGNSSKVAAGPNGTAVASDAGGAIHRWTGSGWENLPGKAREVSVAGDGTIWVIGTNKLGNDWGIYKWDGGNWKQMPGNSSKIAAGPHGTALAADAGGAIHFWDGTKWSNLPGKAREVSIAADGTMWAIGTNQIGNDWGIYKWDGGNWKQMPGNSSKIAAGPDGTAVAADASGSTHFWDGANWSNLPGRAREVSIGHPKWVPEAGTFTRAQLVNLRNQCVDEESGKLTQGGKLILWSCNAGGASRERQLWTHNGKGQIVASNGLCVDVSSGKLKPDRLEKIIVWGCNGSGDAMQRQRWRLLSDGRIQHVTGGQCIDATNDGNQRGELVLNTCSTTPTQRWSLSNISS